MSSRCMHGSEGKRLMGKISIKIDNQDIEVHKGASILEAALAHNIYIPHLCYHPDLKPAGSCRLCLVEMDDGKLLTSCRTTVKEGMVIKTKSAEVDRVRRPIVEMIIANHHMDCRNCGKKGQCALQRIRAYMKIDKKRIQRFRLPQEELPSDDSNPFFVRDHNKCVLCGICVRTCQEIVKVSAIDFACRGNNTVIAPFGNKPIAESKCVSCGECVIRCPVGALLPKKKTGRPSSEVKTTCSYCSIGCGLYLGMHDNIIVNVRGNHESPVNKGLLCVKGRFGMSFVNSPERLTKPLIRKNIINPPSPRYESIPTTFTKGGKEGFVEVSWDEALPFIADQLKNYKADEFALIASTRCTNEDNYIAQKFARVVMGSNNIDTIARLSDAPSLAALLKTLRTGTSTGSISDIEKAACILVIGVNVTHSHPIIGIQIKKAVERGARLIVISPTEIDLCRFAEIWLKPYPGTDLALLMGMNKVIVDDELLDNSFIKKYCDNFEDFKDSLENFSFGRVERITGVSRGTLEEAAKIFATNKPVVILWSEGITQSSHGTDNVLSILNLSIITGNIGQGSSGLIPLFAENNTFGVFDMGCIPDFYPGYHPVTSPEVRERTESLWGSGLNSMPGLTLTEILQAVHEGKIKALYIIGSNPALNIPYTYGVREALKKAEFIVFQDMFMNETAKFANVILPAASFAEKEGTFTNTEGRIQRINKAIEPVGNSRCDWEIICELARLLGKEGFGFTSHEDIMKEITQIVPWYYTDKRGFYTQKDKYILTPLEYRSPEEVSDIDYPLILTTERDVYSSGSLSRKVEGLELLRARDHISLNPKDAADFDINDGETVRIISRWGEVNGISKVTVSSPPGLVIMDFVEEKILQIINPALDPVARTPESKICAVRVESLKESKDE
jgi:formate dehydrogenase alpha subunit